MIKVFTLVMIMALAGCCVGAPCHGSGMTIYWPSFQTW